MSYQIGICEDEEVFKDSLADMVKSIAMKNDLPVKVHTFSNLNRMVSFMEDSLEEPLDLILLDHLFRRYNKWDGVCQEAS